MKSALPAKAHTTLVTASDTFRSLLAPALVALPAQVSQQLVQQAEQMRDFVRYEAALHAEREISRNDRALQQGFARHLTSLLAKSLSTSYADYRPSIHDVPANTALRLVDTGEVEDSVLLMQIAAEYRKHAGNALQELDVRIANLYGQSTVRERENPFRPYLIAKSIALAVADTPVSRAKVLSVTQHLAMALADQAGEIYRQVNDHLRAAGISADLPSSASQPIPAPAPASASASAAVKPSATMPSSAPGAAASHDPMAPAVQGAMQPATVMPGTADHAVAASGSRMTSALAGARQRLQQRLSQWAAQARHGMPTGSATGDAAGQGAAPGAAMVAGEMMPNIARAMPMLKQFLANAARSQATGGSARANAVEDAGAGDATASAAQSGFISPGDLLTFLTSPAANAGHDARLQAEPFPNLIFENRSELERHTSAAEELITIDVVGMLFDFILLDQSVPAAIRAQISRLQYYLLQVALAEPALMTEAGHPARQLVNRIGTASSGAGNKPEAMTLVTGHVRELVDVLLADTVYRPDVLDAQLSRFERFMREIVLSQHLDPGLGTAQETQHLIDALETGSRNALQQEQLGVALGAVLDELDVVDYVRAFLLGPWLAVIVGARTPQDAVRWRELVPTLAWSVLPKPGQASRQQLLSALGHLVRDLKAGLQHGSAKADTDLFLKQLMRTHRTLVGQADAKGEAQSLGAVQAAFDPVLRVQFFAPPAAAAQPVDYLGAVSLTGAGVVETLPVAASLPVDAPDPLAPVADKNGMSAETGTDSVRHRLCVGAEVEIDLDGTIQRGMLVWADSRVRNMLLSFSNGRRPVAVSVRLFKVLLGKGRARFLEAEPLFDRAVIAVLEEAQAQQELELAGAAR